MRTRRGTTHRREMRVCPLATKVVEDGSDCGDGADDSGDYRLPNEEATRYR